MKCPVFFVQIPEAHFMPWQVCRLRMQMNFASGCWNTFPIREKPSCWRRLQDFMTPGLGQNEVRLAYVLNLESIDAAMDACRRPWQFILTGYR